jgi:hypothetical protein
VDWWLRSAAVGDHSEEMDDDHAGRDSFSTTGSSGLSGSRPFSPEAAGNYEMIIAHSAVRPFRHAGNTFKWRVYDAKDALVAEFDVPHTNPATLPVWTAEPLPATKKAQDLNVTLAGLTVDRSESTQGAHTRARYNVTPALNVTRDGSPEVVPSVPDFQYEDAFGNTAGQWDCRLNFHEPAWKLNLRLWPGEQANPDPGSEWTVSGVTLPVAKTAALIRQTATVQGMTIEVLAVGGGDEVTYTSALAPGRHGFNSSSSGGSFAEATFNFEIREKGRTETTTVKCKWPHLLLHVTGDDADHRLVFRARDDQGRVVPAHRPIVSERTVVFLQPDADAKSFDVTFVVQQPKKVEFFVAPPHVEP